MKSVQELATDARRINAANGWGLKFEMDQVPGYLALIHSEITEAWNERDHERIARELGDVVVRALDLGELIEAGQIGTITPETIAFEAGIRPNINRWAGSLMELHDLTSQALEAFRKIKDPAEMKNAVLNMLTLVTAYAWQLIALIYPGHQPAEVVEGILLANAQREYRHGGRRT